jgi:hypothetical protein
MRLVVCYGVYAIEKVNNLRIRNEENILRAVYRIQEHMKGGDSNQRNSQRKAEITPTTDLKALWEKNLRSDIQMTLNEVLSAISFQQLFCNQDQNNRRIDLSNWLRDRLAERTAEWGIQIEEVSIVGLNKTEKT